MPTCQEQVQVAAIHRITAHQEVTRHRAVLEDIASAVDTAHLEADTAQAFIPAVRRIVATDHFFAAHRRHRHLEGRTCHHLHHRADITEEATGALIIAAPLADL